MREPGELAASLLSLAAEDIFAGEAVLATGRAQRVVCFHAQQAAEKTLKAILADTDTVYPWTHDIGELAKLLPDLDEKVLTAARAAVPLSIFAVAVRYEDDIAPEQEEARQALETARRLHELAAETLAPAVDDDDPAG